MRRATLLAALVSALAGCGGGKGQPAGQTPKSKTATIAVIAPFSRESYLGTTIANGTELGVGRLMVPEFTTSADLPKDGSASKDFDVPRK